MEVYDKNASSPSAKILENLDFAEEYPERLDTENEGVASLMYTAPGIFEVFCESSELPPLVITGGIHGDEKAGVIILDRLIDAIITGTVRVRRNLLLMYGNLQAMKANDMQGVRGIEPEVGVASNLNRCFGHGLIASPRCYAERRANEMTKTVEDFVRTHGCPEVIDIHQSFAVPSLHDVRGGADRSDYTYAMLYPLKGDIEATLRWIHEGYSDIVAGVVLNDMALTHHTFAGYMATAHGAHAATFEQGTIGFVDYDTFTPQLQENLNRKIAGERILEATQGFDVWRYVRGIIKNSDDFRFLDPSGNPPQGDPRDFLPLPEGDAARDGETIHALKRGERLLFANPGVPIGDRAAAVIERLETSLVPAPR